MIPPLLFHFSCYYITKELHAARTDGLINLAQHPSTPFTLKAQSQIKAQKSFHAARTDGLINLAQHPSLPYTLKAQSIQSNHLSNTTPKPSPPTTLERTAHSLMFD
jgi:hypothetical protein